MNVDWDRINSFITEDDPEEQEWLKDMINTLIENFEERLEEIAKYADAKDGISLKELLHQLKGIASNFGLVSINEIIIEAEMLVKANNVDSAITEALKIRPLWQITREELKTKLGL